MKSKKILRLALVLGLSCNSLGLNTYAMDGKSTPSEPAVSSDSSAYSEETFFKVARSALEDVYNRMDVYKEGDELTFSYEFKLLKGKSIDTLPRAWMKYNGLNGNLVREILTSVLMGGLSLMLNSQDKVFEQWNGDAILLPSLGDKAFVYMNTEAKSLIEKWKNDGTYNSKIEKIVEPYVGKFIEKFQKQLSEQKNLGEVNDK